MPDEGYSYQRPTSARRFHYGVPGDSLIDAEDAAESAALLAQEEMERGKIEDRTLFTWLDRLKNEFDPDTAKRDITVSIASLLLLRWIESMEKEAAAIAEFEGSEIERSLLPSHTLSHWRDIPAGRLSPYLKTVILPELKSSRGSEYSSYANRLVAGIERFSKLDPMVQADMALRVAAIDPSEQFGRWAGKKLFESVQTWSQRKAGKSFGFEYRTPDDVAWLMTKLVNPAPTDRVYDPCFGSASLLVEAAHSKRAGTSRVDFELWSRMQRTGIYGREIDPLRFLVGLVRVVYSGIDLPRLELGDSLEAFATRGNPESGFDCIVANLPFGLRVSKAIGNLYPIPMVEGEGLFLQHIIDSLRPGGRAVVMVSPSMLSSEGRWIKLRQFLLESNFVDQVVALPTGMFKPYTTIAPSLLVLRKGRRDSQIRFSRYPTPKPHNEEDFSFEDTSDEKWQEEFSYEISVEECARRGYDLRVRDLSSKGVEERIRELAERFPEVEMHKLGQICDVIPGVARRNSATTTNRAEAGANPMGLLRISDVVKGEIREPALYLRPGSAELEKVKARLQPGDLLLSTKGTIGKVAMVPDLPTAVYAADGLTILRPEAPFFLPDYLFGILNSGTYREFLAGMSSGTTLQHLRHTDVRNLPIPIPPLPIQDRVCVEILGSDKDAVLTLSRFLERGEENPFTEWLEEDSAIQALVESAGSSVVSDRLRILEGSVESILLIYRILKYGILKEKSPRVATDLAGDFFPWLCALSESVLGLRKFSKIQSPAERFGVIHLVRIRLSYVETFLKKLESGLWGRARQISSAFRALVEAEARAILDQQTVSCDSPGSVPRDEVAKATISFYNHGPLPLRDVKVTETYRDDEFEVAYWEPNSSFSFEIELQPDLEGTNDTYHPLTFELVAAQLDESLFVKEFSIPVYIEDAAPWLVEEAESDTEPSFAAGLPTLRQLESRNPVDFGPSPYNAGSPVKNEAMLFGRDPILRLVKRQLAAKDRPNVILLEGNRRTGKTSILKRLEKGDLLPDWVVVYCSLQEAEGSDLAGLRTAEIWRLLAKNIGLALLRDGYEPPLPGDELNDLPKPIKVRFTHACRDAFKSDHPFEIFEEFLQVCLEKVSPKRIVLMLDEFDKLQEGIDSGVTSPQVPENLRYLIHEYHTFAAILTGSRRLKRLREEYWSALFGFGHQEGVSALQEEDALALVVEPVREKLHYHPDAAEEIVRVTARQPFLVQNLCNRIYDFAAESGKRRVDLQMVKQVIDTYVEGSEHFRHFWGCADSARRQLILSLIQRAESDPDETRMSLPLLEQTIAEYRVPIPRSVRIADDLAFLREFEMIRLVGKHPNQHYEIEVPLFGRWIAEQVDFNETVRRAVEEGENATT